MDNIDNNCGIKRTAVERLSEGTRCHYTPELMDSLLGAIPKKQTKEAEKPERRRATWYGYGNAGGTEVLPCPRKRRDGHP